MNFCEIQGNSSYLVWFYKDQVSDVGAAVTKISPFGKIVENSKWGYLQKEFRIN